MRIPDLPLSEAEGRHLFYKAGKPMRIFLIYLAAGNSRRFGTNKLLIQHRGKPLFLYGLETLLKAVDGLQGQKTEQGGDLGGNVRERIHTRQIIVVTRYPQIREKAKELGLRCVWGKESEKGVSYSIRAGLLAIRDWDPEDYVLFCVADQPRLTAETVEELLELADGKTETVAVSYRGRKGNPVLFSMRLREELLALSGDEGGRKVLEKHDCTLVEVGQAGELEDIDRPEDVISPE